MLISGDDSDLCSELLSDSLSALLLLPPASLYDPNLVSPVWLEVVDKTTKFLRSVVLENEGVDGDLSKYVPEEDKHKAVLILIELAVQKGINITVGVYVKMFTLLMSLKNLGTLSSILDVLFLLLHIWRKADEDNRSSKPSVVGSAPLVPFLMRFQEINMEEDEYIEDDENGNLINVFVTVITSFTFLTIISRDPES